VELLAERPWPHRTEYLEELTPLLKDRSRIDAAALVLANHAGWNPEIQPLAQEALEHVLEKHSEWEREAVRDKLETVADEFGLADADRARFVERTARRLREVPYVVAFAGRPAHFAAAWDAAARHGEVHSSFRAEAFIVGAWWAVWGELERDEQGVPVIRRLLIEPHPAMEPAGVELAPTTLRALRLPLIRERVLRTLSEPSAYAADLSARARALVELFRAAPPQQGRRGYPDELFELVAIHHVLLKRKHGAYGLNRRLARLETRMLVRHVAQATVKDWIRGAERRGYLRKGPASREAGPRLGGES
jgi:hypothetical protein